MIRAVADTHTIIWYALADPRLSTSARAVFDGAAAARERVALSSISLVEVIYLVEKRKIDARTLDRVLALLDLDELLVEAPVDRPVVLAMRSINRDQVPDMPDRIIAATALRHGAPVISRDGKIRASNVPTLW